MSHLALKVSLKKSHTKLCPLKYSSCDAEQLFPKMSL